MSLDREHRPGDTLTLDSGLRKWVAAVAIHSGSGQLSQQHWNARVLAGLEQKVLSLRAPQQTGSLDE